MQEADAKHAHRAGTRMVPAFLMSVACFRSVLACHVHAMSCWYLLVSVRLVPDLSTSPTKLCTVIKVIHFTNHSAHRMPCCTASTHRLLLVQGPPLSRRALSALLEATPSRQVSTQIPCLKTQRPCAANGMTRNAHTLLPTICASVAEYASCKEPCS